MVANYLLIKNGTIVNDDQEWVADVLCYNGKIIKIGTELEQHTSSDYQIIDATGFYVMPGGIDPHTHLAFPFMNSRTVDDFLSGTTAALAGGTTTIIDFVIPKVNQSLLEAYQQRRKEAESSVCNYGFHGTVTWWSDQIRDEMTILVQEEGVNSFKHFMAYKNAIMCDDETMVKSFSHLKSLGAMPSVHAENGELVDYLGKKLFNAGITEPKGHPLSRPPEVEGEATKRAITIAGSLEIPLYVVHVSSQDSAVEIVRAREKGQRVYGEVLAGHLYADESVYFGDSFEKTAPYVMSPPFREKQHQKYLWNCLKSGQLQTTGTDHCSFSLEQKKSGLNDFRKIPNGCGGVEERLMVLWNNGVNSDFINRKEFVALSSANSAKMFNLYPQKGRIAENSDADIVIWNPKKEKTLSAKTQHSKGDFNVFEGLHIKGAPVYTIVNGEVVWENEQLRAKTGTGKYVKRPSFNF